MCVFTKVSELVQIDLPEEETPSGMMARGSYTAKVKLFDDDDNTYLEFKYSLNIKKDWK